MAPGLGMWISVDIAPRWQLRIRPDTARSGLTCQCDRSLTVTDQSGYLDDNRSTAPLSQIPPPRRLLYSSIFIQFPFSLRSRQAHSDSAQ